MATPRKPSPPRSGRRPSPPRRAAAASSSSRPSRSAASGTKATGARPGAKSPRPDRDASDQPGASAPAKKRPVLGPPPKLTTKQRVHLRGLGHHLAPVVQVGKEGLTDALCQAIGIALLRHELIKLRLAESVEGDRHELAAQIASRNHAALVQVLGRTLLLFRPRPAEDKDPGERLPHVTLH